MHRTVRKALTGILMLVVYFMIFIPLSPQLISLIESFVNAYHHIFVVNFPIKVFTNESGGIQISTQYVSIDLSLLIIFLIYFVVYVVAPFGVVMMLFKNHKITKN